MYDDLIVVGARLQHLVNGISKQTSSVHDDSGFTSLKFVPDLGEPAVVLKGLYQLTQRCVMERHAEESIK